MSFNAIPATLQELVAKSISDAPYHHDGHQWAAHPQQWFCAQLGISVATLRRQLQKPPFVRQRVIIDGKIVCLVRMGLPAPKSKRHQQNILAKIWRAKTGRVISPRGYGCLGGLVDVWAEEAPTILKEVLDNWPSFMSAVKIAITLLGDSGHYRFYEHPSPTVILRFHQVGMELHIMIEQGKVALKSHV